MKKIATSIYEGVYLDKEGKHSVSVYYKPSKKAFLVTTRPVGDYSNSKTEYVATRAIKKFTSGLKRLVSNPNGFCIAKGATA